MGNKYLKNNFGFTLIELLVAMVISTIVAAGIFTAYKSQQDTQLAQEQIVEMQQNLRAALYILTREIRMAGYDPDGTGDYGISSPGDGSSSDPLIFIYYDDDAGAPKITTINLYDSTVDPGNTEDEIQITASGSAIAENISVLQFTYLDKDGNLIPTPKSNIDQIRSIHIVITARPDETLPTSKLEMLKLKDVTRTLETTIKCRNLGL